MQVKVAEAGVEEVRAAFAEFGAAIAITPAPLEEGMTTFGGGPRGPHDGWPAPTLPLDAAVGMASDAVAQTCRDEGFRIEIYQYGFGRLGFVGRALVGPCRACCRRAGRARAAR